MRLLVFNWFFISLIFVGGQSVAQDRKFLPPPDSFVDTLTFNTQSMHMTSKDLILLSQGSHFLVQQKLPGKNVKFPKIIKRKKFVLDKMNLNSRQMILDINNDIMRILDGKENRVFKYLKKKLIGYQSVVYDKILPPRDRGGEAPNYEQKSLQDSFKKEYKETDLKFSGGAKLPKGWVQSDDDDVFLIASRIPKFPILAFACDQSNPLQCSIIRKCFVKGTTIEHKHINGLGLFPSSRSFVIGDESDNKLEIFSFKTCLNIVKINEIYLPKKFKKISNIFVDASENLWISTQTQDDYTNATIYKWNAETIKKLIF